MLAASNVEEGSTPPGSTVAHEEASVAKSRTKTKQPAKTRAKDPVSEGSLPPPARANVPALVGAPKGWGKAGDALERVTAVRTIFPDFNLGTRIGGLPTKRIITVHGPTHGGKSAFVLGLERSFIDPGFPGALVDAEHSTPKDFVNQCMGRDIDEIENFFAERPSSYEETIEKVDSFLKWVGDLRKGTKERAAHPELASILAVDSVNKLVPDRELEQLTKSGDNIDKGWGRYRAAMNQAWLDHLVPLLGAANCAFVAVAQERESKDAKSWEIPQVKGGAALLYDASLICRVSKAEPLRDGPADDKQAPIIGFRHRVRIWKSKVGAMDGFYTDVAFHLSNGALVPAGFDTARDALHVGRKLGIIEISGSWLTWKKRRWQGERKAHLALANDAEMLGELLAEINTRIDDAARGA